MLIQTTLKQIPLSDLIGTNSKNYDFFLTLNDIEDGRIGIRFKYNSIFDAWFMDLSLDNEFVITSRKLVTNLDLLIGYNLPVGALFLISTSGEETVTRDGLLDGTYILYYMDYAESN